MRAAAREARLVGEPAAEPSAPPPSSHARTAVSLERHGELWRFERAGRVLTLKHSRGLELLARLVERRGEEIHVLALASDEPGASVADQETAGLIDEQAKRAYRVRLRELEHTLAEAEQNHDLGRIRALEKERSLLDAELERAFGLGGKARRSGSPSERARVNVQRRLKDTIARIAELDAECGQFLTRAVRTGNYCIFSP